LSEEVFQYLCDECTDLFVDEAHHISANTWSKIRERFVNKHILQFTATPFRTDGKALGGKIIYNYTIGEAQEAGYFKKINMLPVEEYFEAEADKSIALEAVSKLRDDIANNKEHLILARVNSKPRAEEVHKIYIDIAPDLNPIIIHSDLSGLLVQERLDLLHSQKAKIVVCVDMLGEGYDLPNLKIAAIHDHHKSLAITLQFIGRFTRSSNSGNIGDATAIVNIADPGIESGLKQLYSQDADWDSILRRLSEDRISKEIDLQKIIDSLKSKGDLHSIISLWNIKPSLSSMLLETRCEEWQPEKFTEY
jgi:superfamily II DNA or RNA helicase